MQPNERRRKNEEETEPEKKWTKLGEGMYYIAIFPTEINCCRWHKLSSIIPSEINWNAHAPKKFENPARLFDPSENPSVFVQTDRCLTCVRFGMCIIPSVFYVRKPSVIVAQSRKCFATLCEIPTGCSPSVKVAQSRNFFQLSLKYRRVLVRRCTRRWNRKFFLFFCVTVSQNLELQSYSTRSTITKADH